MSKVDINKSWNWDYLTYKGYQPNNTFHNPYMTYQFVEKYMENNASKVVTDVINVLESVSFVEILDISDIEIFEYFFKFSRIRSNITTVSFIEYPTIVNTAAIIDKFISNFKSIHILYLLLYGDI